MHTFGEHGVAPLSYEVTPAKHRGEVNETTAYLWAKVLEILRGYRRMWNEPDTSMTIMNGPILPEPDQQAPLIHPPDKRARLG